MYKAREVDWAKIERVLDIMVKSDEDDSPPSKLRRLQHFSSEDLQLAMKPIKDSPASTPAPKMMAITDTPAPTPAPTIMSITDSEGMATGGLEQALAELMEIAGDTQVCPFYYVCVLI